MANSQILTQIFYELLFLVAFSLLSKRLISQGKKMKSRAKGQDYHLWSIYQQFVGNFMIFGGVLALIMGILWVLRITVESFN